LQYLHRVELAFIQIVNSHNKFIVFVFWVLNVVALLLIAIEAIAIDVVTPPPVAIEGVH
jgi:hypothetical protein